MPGDPNECRTRARRCTEIAAETPDLILKKKFTDLAGQWGQLAADIDGLSNSVVIHRTDRNASECYAGRGGLRAILGVPETAAPGGMAAFLGGSSPQLGASTPTARPYIGASATARSRPGLLLSPSRKVTLWFTLRPEGMVV
jgi:hypothetical protein